jgi:hypothetical protein
MCPDAALFCSDAGLLTCGDALNDCSAHGDCFKGKCYCHTGFGGDDCSLRICTTQCPDV